MEQYFYWGLQTLGAILMTILWYMYRSSLTRLDNIEQKLQDTREQYVHKDDLKELKSEINHRFDKLEDLIQKRIN